MREQSVFEVAFMRLRAEAEEVEIVGVFEQLAREVGLRRRQSAVKVGERLALPRMEARVYLMREHVAAPAVLDGCPHVPLALSGILHFIQQHTIMEPGNLCSSLLHNCL